MGKFCTNCGTEISDIAKKCPSCGANIDSLLLKKGEPSKADENKESVKFWYNRGIDFSHANNYEKALEAYDQALTFDDKDPDIWNNKCYVLTNLRRYDEAIEAGNKGVELAPNDPQIWDCLRDAYLASNNPEKADDCSKKISILENSFSPIEKSDHKIIYEKCVSKSVYYFNIIAIWLIIVVNVVLSFKDGKIAEQLGRDTIYYIAFALGWFWIAPSGVRRVYNKSHGSRLDSNIAFLICTWFNFIGWVASAFICWIHEKL